MSEHVSPIKAGEVAEAINRSQYPKITIDVGAGEMFVSYGTQGYGPLTAKTDEARFVLEQIAPFLQLFLEKNEKYAKVQDAGFPLGARGVFPDINRKVGILFDRIWNDNQTPGEPTMEVIADLIGHLFLMMYHLDKESTDGRR